MKPRDSSWLFRVARSCRNRTSEKQKLENHAIYRNESFPDQKFSFSLGIFFVAQTQAKTAWLSRFLAFHAVFFLSFLGKSGQNRPIFTCMQVTCQSVGSTQQAPFCRYSSSLSTLFLLCTASKCVYILSVVVTSACPICAQACTTSTPDK